MQSIQKREPDMIGLLLFLSLLINAAVGAIIDDIFDQVSKDTTSLWTYKNMFPDLDSLLLNESCLKHGIAVDGDMTVERIQRMLDSAIQGKSVNMFVLGGSSTLGADLGKDNLKLTYHYALADWWNKTIGAVTGSYMQRKVLAVGGVGTTYFGHCWQEYVNTDEKFDFVTWEFAINDQVSYKYGKVVEKFTRDILSLQSRPGLTFVNFARRKYVVSNAVKKIEGKGEMQKVVDKVAKTYSSTSLRWENLLWYCRKVNLTRDHGRLFRRNHPKATGHAQMAYALINYFKRNILHELKKLSNKQIYPRYVNVQGGTSLVVDDGFISNNTTQPWLPEPVFMTKEEIDSESKCFSSISSGPWNLPKYSLESLPVLLNKGFTVLRKSPWKFAPEDRHDSTGGYVTKTIGSSLRLKFTVPSSNALSQISVTVRNKPYGGRVRFVLNEGTAGERTARADTSSEKRAGTILVELGSAAAGDQTLSVYTETGGCNLCAVIIDRLKTPVSF